VTRPELRIAARAVVLDPDDRVLLVRFQDPAGHTSAGHTWWATPGGALDAGETHEDALRRELREEAGISAPIGRCLWVREHVFEWGERLVRQVERYYLVRTDSGAIAPELTATELAEEAIHEHRWWSLAELGGSSADFAPRRLAELLRDLLERGPPAEPIDAGV
jgi:ADP-ribose pyrophosphatase YjhB (NUDIX family)